MIPGLSLARYRVTVEAKDDLVLPAYLGSSSRPARCGSSATRPSGRPGRATPSGSTAGWSGPASVFGQWTHVGGGCTFGLGRYRLASEALPE
jgi:hypothetical protein